MSSPTSPGSEPVFTLKIEAPPKEDPGHALLRLLVNELLRRLEDPEIAKTMTASEMELVRKVCSDNSISLAAIRRGDFGEVAQRAAEEFPFPEGPAFPGVAEGPQAVQ